MHLVYWNLTIVIWKLKIVAKFGGFLEYLIAKWTGSDLEYIVRVWERLGENWGN